MDEHRYSRAMGVRPLTPQERAREDIQEEPLAADAGVRADPGIGLRMERVEQCTADQVDRPDWGDMFSKEPSYEKVCIYSLKAEQPRTSEQHRRSRTR